MVGRRSLVAFLVLSVLGPIFFDYPHRLRADVTTESAVVPRAYIPFVAKNMWIGTTTMSGTVNVDNLSVAGGSTIRTIGDTTINAQGSVNIGGELLTDGGRLTINALGDVLITGVITPTILTRTETSPGHVEITGRNITVLASDPSRVVIQSLGNITMRTTPPSSLQAVQGTVYISGSITAGNGRDGEDESSVSQAGGKADARPDPTSFHNDWIQAGGTIFVPAPTVIGSEVWLRAGYGGYGGLRRVLGADGCPGTSVSVTNARPGDNGGDIRIGFLFVDSDAQTFPVTVKGKLAAGDGGMGARVFVSPGNGSGPGCRGGNGTGVGGDGGNGGSVYLPPDAEVVSESSLFAGFGGAAGEVYGAGGNGAAGAYDESPDGGAGGNFSLSGGNGGATGSAPARAPGIEEGGTGGSVWVGFTVDRWGKQKGAAGNGGNGADGCGELPPKGGGAGGDGGTLTLLTGANGPNRRTPYQPSIYINSSANGGHGGYGTVGGPGGLSGLLSALDPVAENTASLQPGAKGGEPCPTITVPPSVESKEWFTLRIDHFPPGAVIEIVVFKNGAQTDIIEVTIDANGRYEGLIWLSTCGGDHRLDLKARMKGQSDIIAQTQILVMGDPACSP